MELVRGPEERALQDSIRGLLARDAPATPGAAGLDSPLWSTFADQGWLAAGMAQESGGFGDEPYFLALIAEELGRALVREPFVPVAATASLLIQTLDPAHRLLTEIARGSALPLLAHSEPEAYGDDSCVATRAVAHGDGFRLSGRKAAILGGPDADILLVSARSSEATRLSVFAVDPAADGLVRQDYRTVDNRRASNLILDDVEVTAEAVLGPLDGAADAVRKATDYGLVIGAAESLGSIDVALEMTRDYLNTRRQFGRLIGEFQALRHRLADMFIESQQARSIMMRALAALTGDAGERSRLASAAKLRVSEAGREVTGQAIQLHGGIGLAEEFAIGHYFKRLIMFSLLGGSDAAHLERYLRLSEAPAD